MNGHFSLFKDATMGWGMNISNLHHVFLYFAVDRVTIFNRGCMSRPRSFFTDAVSLHIQSIQNVLPSQSNTVAVYSTFGRDFNISICF